MPTMRNVKCWIEKEYKNADYSLKKPASKLNKCFLNQKSYHESWKSFHVEKNETSQIHTFHHNRKYYLI